MIEQERLEYLNKISESIIGAAIEVHKYLGPGLLESVYEICLVEELEQRGLKVEQQVFLPVYYKGKQTRKTFKIDLLVENEVIIELKATTRISHVFEHQLMTYLKLTKKPLGLLINFDVPRLVDGVRRRLNG